MPLSPACSGCTAFTMSRATTPAASTRRASRRPRRRSRRCWRRRREPERLLCLDIALVGFGQEEDADDRGDRGEDDRIPESLIDIARRGDHREADRRHETPDPAVADMIGQRQRTVADARREQLDEQRGERTIDHRREQAEDAEDADHLHLVDLRRVGGGGIAGAGQPRVEILLKGGDGALPRRAGQRAGVGCPVDLVADARDRDRTGRSEEHTSELQSLMRISYAVFCLKKKKHKNTTPTAHHAPSPHTTTTKQYGTILHVS